MRARRAIAKRSSARISTSIARSSVVSIPWIDAGRRGVHEAARPDAIVSANDRTAGKLMQTLLRLGYAIPRDIRMVGIDDVEFASLLPVPLTTLRQPTRAIGDAALGAMLQRVARKDLPARDILLDFRLIVRESCGGS